MYVAFRWVIPAALIASTPKRAYFTVNKPFADMSVLVSPLVLVFFGITTILSIIWHVRRGTFFKNNANSKAVQAMNWREFEILISEYYKRQGYSVDEIGGGGPDGGVDLILRKEGEKILVQCKHWKAFKIGVSVLRELYGVMVDAAASKAIVVTSGDFTADALDFAQDKPITLIDRRALSEMLASVAQGRPAPQVVVNGKSFPLQVANANTQPSRYAPKETPACPHCKIPMVLRTAKHGKNTGSQFWGCKNYPDCRQTQQYNGS